jgi:uncharacterized protein
MEQRISLVTLGVRDLGLARRFYESLGWQGQEVDETVFFQAGGQAVVLWGIDKLAADAGVALAEPHEPSDGEAMAPRPAFGGIVLAHNVRSAGEVDAVVAAARAAGATITRDPDHTFYGGYAGCFSDPDGHIWEVAHNPGFPLAEDGTLTVPPLPGEP